MCTYSNPAIVALAIDTRRRIRLLLKIPILAQRSKAGFAATRTINYKATDRNEIVMSCACSSALVDTSPCGRTDESAEGNLRARS